MRTANHAGTAEIIAIIDRSGSMSGLEADTIEGYNALLARQSEIGPTCVTCVLFDDKVERPFAGVPAAQAKLTRDLPAAKTESVQLHDPTDLFRLQHRCSMLPGGGLETLREGAQRARNRVGG